VSRKIATLRREIRAACAAAFPGLQWAIRGTEVRGRGACLEVGFSVSSVYVDRLVSFVTAAPFRGPGLLFLEATEVRPQAATTRAVVAAVRASLRRAERLCDTAVRLREDIKGADGSVVPPSRPRPGRPAEARP
jgi:hypothetical protein